jgi:hypothetical protein
MRFCMDRTAEPLGVEAEVEDNAVSDSEGEEDQEHADVDVQDVMAACPED